jgi:hypothetical protein
MIRALNKYMETQFKKDLISALGWLALWIIVEIYVNVYTP